MRKLITLAIITVIFLSPITYMFANEGDRFEETVNNVGLKASDIAWDMDKLNRLDSDPFRLSWFNELWSNPMRIPRVFRQMTDRIPLYAGRDGSELNVPFFYGAAKTCGYVAAFFDTYLPTLPITSKQPTLNAIKLIYNDHGWEFGPDAENKMSTFEKSIDQESSNLYAEFILSARFLEIERRKVFEKTILDKRLFKKLLGVMTDEETDGLWFYRLGLDFDQKQMMYACCRVVFATQKLKNASKEGKLKIPKLDLFTPFGRLIVDGSETNNSYGWSDYLLIVDGGGDDIYTCSAGSTVSYQNCASVVIDVKGNDKYIAPNDQSPTFGAGVLGCGILCDLAGNDSYLSVNYSQGIGLLGVGILADYSGDDIYDGIDFVQGAASFGVGIAIDINGSDEYKCFFGGQGYGYTMGFGLLYDKTGNDFYDSNDTQIIHPSAQNANHNTSMAQGCGNGRRADITDGHSMSGGVGMLIDEQGDDIYSCGVFGQGVAYWFGIGILSDNTGNDTYKGLWYVQGATAHFAISLFRDGAGDDHYQALQATSIGVGHDFSISWHMDSGGNDTYDCWRIEKNDKGEQQTLYGGLMLGCGNETGMGIFLNVGGDDIYEGRSENMYGGAYVASPTTPDTIRNELLCLGLFLDVGGVDAYGKIGENNKNWVRKAENRPTVVIGVGADYESGTVPFVW